MSAKINRRDFVAAGAAAGMSLAIPSKGEAQAPNIIARSDFKPLVISSGNGNSFRNGGTQTAVEKAFSMITGGSDVLDAVVAGVNIVELDPLD
jgi:N4-(beta-N-acetylglucosaminyl)-L-asparaginase